MVLVFLIPGVQTYTAQRITESINSTYGTAIDIERIKININADVVIENAIAYDHKKDTLIYFSHLSSSVFNISNMIASSNLDLGNTEIEDLEFNMVRYKDENSNNLKQFLKKFDTNKNQNNAKPFKLHIDDIFLTNGALHFIDYNKKTTESFSLENLSLEVDNLNIIDSDISLVINHLSGITGYGLTIEKLKTTFLMNTQEMKLKNLNLQTPYSFIQTDLKFMFEDGDWLDFENKVKIKADFDTAQISTKDMNYFYNEFSTNNQLFVSGQFIGTLNDFSLNNIYIDGLQNSKINGDIQFVNITDPNTITLKTNNIDIDTNYYDLKNLLPELLGESLPEFIKHMGNFNLKGMTSLAGNDLSANLQLDSGEGKGVIQLDFNNLNTKDRVTYKGRLKLKELNLGKITHLETLGLTNFNLNIEGKGFTKESLDTQLTGIIKSLQLNNYTYRNIEVNGNLQYPIFNGELTSKDPNFLFDFKGLVDASKTNNRFKFKSTIQYADLKELNLLKNESISIFKGDLDINVVGNSIDDAIGTVNFNNFNYQNSTDTYMFDDFVVESKIINNQKQISVNSPDVINGKMIGNYKLSELNEFIDVSFRNLYFKDIVENRFKNKNLKFNFNIYNKVVEAFFPKLSIAPNTFLNGNISTDQDEMKVKFVSPRIKYAKQTFREVEIQLDKKNPFFDTYIQVTEIDNSVYPVSSFNLINANINDTLFFRTEFKGGKNNKDNYNLSFYQSYDEDQNTILGIQKSDFFFKNKTWKIDNSQKANNKIVLESGLQNFIFDSIFITHQDQYMKLNGVIKDSTFKDINLQLHKIELSNITPYIDSLDLKGLVNGDINIYQKEKKYAPNLEVLIKDFSVNNLYYGNLKLSADGNKDLSDFKVKAYLSKEQNNYLSAKGVIKNQQGKQKIDIDAEITNLDISSLSPLGEDVLSNIRGKISGEAKLFGDLSNPDLSGELNLNNAGLSFPYLNVDFNIEKNAKITLENKKFIFEDILLEDTKYNTQSILGGNINHDRFNKWDLNLFLKADNTLTLDTSYDEESLYYGTAFISGLATISGPTDALEINVFAESEPNTIINIPLSDTETIGDNSFIYFLTQKDKDNVALGKEIMYDEISGLSLNFDLDITNDALVEIVIDQESGSLLRGRGEGDLRLEINTNGKFNMFGEFNTTLGEYIYKYKGIIEKRFEVIPGGFIVWNGNPIDANIDIQAKYTTEANPASILENPSLNRDIPVDVLISLEGKLMQPNIGFDLEYPNLSSTIKSELEYRIQGRENEEKQALSLLAINAFLSNNGLGLNNVGVNLVSERASSLLDQLLKDEEGKFNIGFNYIQAERTPNQNAIGSDRVGMTLQTQLSDKIFINGRFGVPVGGETQSFVFGDVEINFLLNKSGSLRAQMFNKESNIQFIGEELGYTQGIGILYTVSFETFGELISKMINREYYNKKEHKNIEAKENIVPTYILFPNDN